MEGRHDNIASATHAAPKLNLMKRYLLFVSKPYSFEILRPLQRAIRARGDEAAWFIHGIANPALAPGEMWLKTVADVKQFNPAAVFVPGNWVPDFFPGLKVQIFHGFGIEKKGHFRIRGFFDLYCTHGPATTGPFEALARQHCYFSVVETGWPKMDPLFQNDDTAPLVLPGADRPVVLYAPTFSPSLSSAAALRETIAALARDARWQWVVKFHPKMAADEVAAYHKLQGPNLIVADSERVLPLLRRADVMVSDTSSVVSEFLLLDKPVVTYRTTSPGSHVIDIQQPTELESALTRALQHPTDVMTGAREFIAQMHPYRDGKSSERVLQAADATIKDGQIARARKPLNLYRRLALRWRMRTLGL